MTGKKAGWAPIVAGSVIAASLLFLVPLPSLRGEHVVDFLVWYSIAGLAYIAAILRLSKGNLSLKNIWGFAILFRLILLFTQPSLSDDVYRYLWDGHLINKGINPYALPVNSPLLDAYDTYLRAFVNHNWMASPYLPATQVVFAIVSRLAPQSMLAFQLTAVLFDLSTGWLIMDLLARLELPKQCVLVYLWNPLVVVEFAHGAHLDSLMLFLMMAAFWLLVRYSGQANGSEKWKKRMSTLGSILSLAFATLTKFLPVLIAPLFYRRWGWKGMILFAGCIVGVLSVFAGGAGWGLTGPLDGTGVFGAIRIYLRYWNYNSSIYHWLEILFSDYPTPGPVPAEIVGETPILFARTVTSGLLGLVILFVLRQVWLKERGAFDLLRLSMLPLGAYLLLTPTVHPWYVTLIIPFLPFMMNSEGESISVQTFFWAWIYFSISVAFSYLTYIDPDNLREYTWVRLVEYIPLYLLLGWTLIRLVWNRKIPFQSAI